jgi:fused signal recognition particle receptor
MIFNVLEKLKHGLNKTRKLLSTDIGEILKGRKIDEETICQLEETLIKADMGIETTDKIITHLKQAYKEGKLTDSEKVQEYLKAELISTLKGGSTDLIKANTPPTVILVSGVNGTGKTTSIAKLAYLLKKDNKKIILAASDTFRAAAIEQLNIWAERIGVEIIGHATGADPAAVVFDAVEAAIARHADFLIVDTAGRLHTKTNLMNELTKIRNVISKKIPGAPHETLLVLDATTGQNAIIQAKQFNEAVNITGLFLAKLDGTAKGGIIVAIKNQLNIPVKFIGLGEQIEDIEAFDPERFVNALFETT